MQRSVAVAASNLDTHVKTAVGNYENLKGWAFETLKDQEKLLLGWEESLSKLGRVPLHPEVLSIAGEKTNNYQQLHKKANSVTDVNGNGQTLLNMVNVDEVQKAGQNLGEVAVLFERKVTELGSNVENIRKMAGNLANEIQYGKKE